VKDIYAIPTENKKEVIYTVDKDKNSRTGPSFYNDCNPILPGHPIKAIFVIC